MTKTLFLDLRFTFEVDGDGEVSEALLDALLANLNISDEVNDRFMDSLQENLASEIISYKFS